MNITISGLTAAGKTTHALLVARRLGFGYVSASALMFGRLGIANRESNTLWQSRFGEVEKLRDERPVDEELNAHLEHLLKTRDNTVFDSWSAPWLPDVANCLRIFIESDIRSRTLKVRVSQEPHGPFLSLPECRRLLERKDTAAAERLGGLLNADIMTDRSPYDLVLDNSELISRASIADARRGIAVFHERLLKAVFDHQDRSRRVHDGVNVS
ncbi:cytidylate kinase family protein [Actinocrispum sp. NPDC049592]|uniref:cytidylate kinase-like family protein n=1 Tax=Actinocrispum sp. NPDC049592 TaxID=3154835 RepID=UPI00342B6CB6